jgi:putative N6-adenine-specific DNA methylase
MAVYCKTMEKRLERKIKRFVYATTHRFLAVVQPAFQEVCRKELESENIQVSGEVEGGIEFEGKLEEGWKANLLLRSASRVYCRMGKFRAGAREEFYRKARNIPWELWISPNLPLRIEAVARSSRIHHEGVLRDTLYEAIVDRFVHEGIYPPSFFREEEEGAVQRILVRSNEAECEISLDMSGKGLHRRGYRKETGKAPIREDLAAALLILLGWKGKGILCDPMTGSGTFAIEGALIASQIPPGWNRTFVFQYWPSFREARWNYLKRSLKKEPGETVCCFASDTDEKILSSALRNAASAGIEKKICFEQRDFFSLNGKDVLERLNAGGETEKYLVLNPPYGKRLERDRQQYGRIGRHLQKAFSGWKALVIVPSEVPLSEISKSIGRIIGFRHGGEKIHAIIL